MAKNLNCCSSQKERAVFLIFHQNSTRCYILYTYLYRSYYTKMFAFLELLKWFCTHLRPQRELLWALRHPQVRMLFKMKTINGTDQSSVGRAATSRGHWPAWWNCGPASGSSEWLSAGRWGEAQGETPLIRGSGSGWSHIQRLGQRENEVIIQETISFSHSPFPSTDN